MLAGFTAFFAFRLAKYPKARWWAGAFLCLALAALIGGTYHGAWGHLELEGVSIAFAHGDSHQLLHDLEHADTFDFFFHGHTHIAREHRTGKTRIINPGALQRVAVRTFLLLDLPSGVAESVTVE